MVSSLPTEGGPIISARVRKIIQSIKEIVGNHSEGDIYTTLKESNMDPNETAQKLLNQDHFHEVKRRKDKKKESMGYRGSTEPRRTGDHVGPGMRPRIIPEYKGSIDPSKHDEHVGQGLKPQLYSDRSTRKGGFTRKTLPGTGHEFRVVRDNRVNQNTDRESKPALNQHSPSLNEQGTSNANQKSSAGAPINHRPSSGRNLFQASNGPIDTKPRHARDAVSNNMDKKESTERQTAVPNAVSRVQVSKPSAVMSSNNSVLGVYSSSSDPVHVPSLDSRSPAAVGAIKREVGVVGVRQQSSENSVKTSSVQSSPVTKPLLGREESSSVEPYQQFNSISKGDKLNHSTLPETIMPSMSVGRSLLGNQYGSRPHQQLVVHQKAPQSSKEWKPKSSKKSSSGSPGVIGVPANSASATDKSKDMKPDANLLQDKLSEVNGSENQNVIIAQHIRVAQTDRSQLTFGSFGPELDSPKNIASGIHAVEDAEENGEPSTSLSVSAPDPPSDTSSSQQLDVLADHVRHSGLDSSVSGAAHEPQLADKRDSLTPQNLENYTDIGLVQDNSASYTPSDSQQRQDAAELPNFSAYDPQTGYDIPYFRPTMDESVRGQDMPSPQESLSSHTANSIPASTIAMVQQQPTPVAQMYPQVHMSHFTNLMPYRQFLSPVYVPPMPMPGYSNNPAYPHPSNGSSYLLMPGGNSHLGASGLKYGIQQFKPVPAGSPTGFGNFTNPTGYAINAPGVVGNTSGLEDSSRLKYKDGNIYVPNPQAETSEIWVQNPRDIPGLQSAPYYNLPGQTPHAAYMPSHTGHASFNAAAAQSSHMQFPGLYHPPPQPTAIANPHHIGPAMGANVGVGVAAAAPGTQVGAYQQPQLGHLNWTTNF